MDADNTFEPALARDPPTSAVAAALAHGARWRQRGGSTDGCQRVDPSLPLIGESAPGEPAQAALRDAELRGLARRAKGATLRLDFELRTALVRQVFRRDFVYVSKMLHGLEASRRVQGLDRAGLDGALAALRRRADGLDTMFQRLLANLQAAIARRAPANASLAFARPGRFQATLVGPTAHRYLTLLLQADETLAALEMAWLLGLVDPASRAACTSDCRRALHGFKDLASDRRQAVGEQVRQANALRRAPAATPANEDGA